MTKHLTPEHDAELVRQVWDLRLDKDARRFQEAMCHRLGEFSLSLHPEKTRLIEFGRFARSGMSRQLYIQCVMMKELVRIASEEVTLHFAQRRPRELAKFEWTIDAKDPRRITSQEKWWRETLALWLESASRREPFIFVEDAGVPLLNQCFLVSF